MAFVQCLCNPRDLAEVFCNKNQCMGKQFY